MTKPATLGLPSSKRADNVDRALERSELWRSPLIPGTLDCIFRHLQPFNDGGSGKAVNN